VHVGFKLAVVAAPDAVWVAALIDGSSIPFYDFEALVSVPPRGAGENLRLGQLFRYGHSKFGDSSPGAARLACDEGRISGTRRSAPRAIRNRSRQQLAVMIGACGIRV
jgi:hypothetical protein